MACRVAGRLDEAVEHLETVLEVSPDDLDALNDLAVTLSERQGEGDIERAVETLTYAAGAQRALKLRRYDSHYNLGNMFMLRGEAGYETAAAEYERALRCDGGADPDVRNNLGCAYHKVSG